MFCIMHALTATATLTNHLSGQTRDQLVCWSITAGINRDNAVL